MIERRVERTKEAAFEHGQRTVLEHVAAGRKLADVLEEIVLLIEAQGEEGMLCSILLLDRDAKRVRHGAAPHLPRELVEGVDGSLIGPHEGSCGAAAYLGEPVIVEDIGTHPNWANYRHLLLPSGLRSCWSSPISTAPRGEVMGTFAMYYREARAPTDAERSWVARATHLAAIAIARDRDERALERTQKELYRSEAELRVVFENAAVGMALLTDGGHITRSNPSLQDFLGYSAAELERLTLADVTHPEDREGNQLTQNLSSHEHGPHHSERRYLRKNGDVVWGRMTASLVRSPHDPHCIIVLVENVTERRKLEETVRSSEHLREMMYGAVTDVLFYLGVEPDRTYRFLSVNPAFIRATGLSEKAVIGKTVDQVIPEPSRQLVLSHYERAIREKRTVTWEEVTPYPAGKKYGEVSIAPIFDSDGACTNLVGTVRDVTEKKNLEAQLFHGQRLESLGLLAAGIAHDFNNVLTAILGNASMAEVELGEAHPATQSLAEIEKAAARGSELIRQLLTFGRRQESRRKRTSLPPPVSEALGLLRASVSRKIRIETHFDPNAPEVLGDPTQIHQIVMNLGTNAVHAMGEEEGTLAVRVERVALDRDLNLGATALHPGTYAKLVVSDTGAGMDESTLDHIFDPFFTTKGPKEGSGLGLSVVHGIVRNHDGGISVTSSPGRGTEFNLYFPAAPATEQVSR